MNADDLNFAYKVRHALNARAEQLPTATTDRLAAARKLAMARKKPHAPLQVAQGQLASNVGSFLSFSLLGRLGGNMGAHLGVILPLMALVVGLAGIYQYEEEQRIAEIAELDAAVLSDELPLNAYLDQGFNAYLAQRGQN